MQPASRHRASSKRLIGNTQGAEIAEAALVMPLVFMLLLGMPPLHMLPGRARAPRLLPAVRFAEMPAWSPTRWLRKSVRRCKLPSSIPLRLLRLRLHQR